MNTGKSRYKHPVSNKTAALTRYGDGMNRSQVSIELHDSNLAACYSQDKNLVIELRPAYVHTGKIVNNTWIGKGCSVDARININKPVFLNPMPKTPGKISSGTIQVGNKNFDNIVPAPFAKHGRTHLTLRFVTKGALDVVGESVSITLGSNFRFVEDLPEEWAPSKQNT
jgi:hypothetical protein